MIARIPAIRRRAGSCGLAVSAPLLVAAAALACVPTAGHARAAIRYVIKEPIYEILETTKDAQALCRLSGISMSPLVIFLPPKNRGMSVYWHGPTDRFVQYPGTGGSVIWKHRGQ